MELNIVQIQIDKNVLDLLIISTMNMNLTLPCLRMLMNSLSTNKFHTISITF